MAGFYFTLLAVLLSGLGARDQVTVAGLALKQGFRWPVLVVGVLVSVATAALAAWAATLIAPLMPSPARLFLSAIALAFAGAESLVLAPRSRPQEPTHSLGALTIVLIAHQLTDAPRFLVFAVAIAAAAPVNAGIGGAIGGIALIAAGCAVPELVTHPRARLARRLVGVALLLLAAWIALRVMVFA